MATVKEQQFSFGGVDSRSNPANYPPNRALRCVNYTPLESGQLRLRQGYTVPSGATADALPIHSAVYYEQFSAAYLGPQYVLYGKGTAIKQVAVGTGTITAVGSFTTSNPWGHFRSKNRIFLADGISNFNWDGSTLRITGLPAPGGFSNSTSAYCSIAASSGWNTPANIEGAPDAAYSTASVPAGFQTLPLYATGYGTALAIPSTSTIQGIAAKITGHVSALSAGGGAPTITLQLLQGGIPVGNPVTIGVSNGLGTTDATIVVGDTNSLWNTTWTPALINSNTGFGVSIIATTGFGSGSITFSLDSVQIVVSATGLPSGTVTVTSSTLGSIAPTQLTGYQLYAAIYNPVTQHMGNRVAIGGLNTIGATASAFIVSGLPTLSSFNSEWEYALGMTNDGGQVPYWFVDAQGNHIILGNSATSGTVFIGNVDPLSELPFRNNLPRNFDKFARVGTRIFAGYGGNPFLSYSNDVADVSNANYVGNPEESWPPDQQEPLPDGQLPMSIHGYRLEGWFFSRENLNIWSQFLLQQGANPWRGPWPGGCAGQRAFIETPHGPFWVSAQKQLSTFMEDGVISISEEYETALLGKIANQFLAQTEISYLLDPSTLTDEIVVRGTDVNGNPVIVVHDFNLEDERSTKGQGYSYQYTGLTIQTFVGAGFTPRQNVYDTTARMRLWAGSTQGFFAQLEDGLSDNGATYTGDYVGLVGLGTQKRSLVELEYQGDPSIQFSYLPDYSLGIGDFIPVTQETLDEQVQSPTRFGVKFGDEECRWVYVRLQLTSHPGDGNFTLSDPPYLPMPFYGGLNETVLKLGAGRPEAR